MHEGASANLSSKQRFLQIEENREVHRKRLHAVLGRRKERYSIEKKRRKQGAHGRYRMAAAIEGSLRCDWCRIWLESHHFS